MTAGADAYGAFAQSGGTLALATGTVVQTSGKGSYGLFASNGGSISGNGLNVTTSGGFGILLNTADGVAASTGSIGPGTITLQNSTITANGLGANGLFVSGAGSSITLTNSNILSSLGSGASVNNGAILSLSSSNLTALVHGIVVAGGTVFAPNAVTVSGGNLITVLGDAFQVENGATNIIVSDGATVTGNSSLLRVLDQPATTVVNFTADHASLFGDIFADSASQTTVNLTDSTVLTGKVNPLLTGLGGVDMSIDNTSQWMMTGNSNIKSLSVSPGASVVFSAPLGDVHHTLTIGSLIGTGAVFGMNIDLRRGVGDLIDITGASDGSHLLTFFDRGHGTDLRANEALLLVKTPDGIAGFSGMTDRAVTSTTLFTETAPSLHQIQTIGIWFARTRWANLLFALTAVATSLFAGCELWMMRAKTPEAFGIAMRWADVPFWVMIVSLVGFVRFSLQAGRLWLAWTVCGSLSLILNFICTPNLNYREIPPCDTFLFSVNRLLSPKGF